MKQGAPLKRTAGLKASKGLSRSGRLRTRPRKKLSAEERNAAGAFKASVQGKPCIVCGRVWPTMDAHHGVEAEFLRRHHPQHVYDARNACAICPWWEGPCHGDHTSAMRRIPRSSLPESVEEFAAELGCVGRLDRTYAGLA